MSETIGSIPAQGGRHENHRRKIEKEKNEQGMVYFNNKKIVVTINNERDGGLGILIAKRKFDTLNLAEGNLLELEMTLPSGKRGKEKFIVRHVTLAGMKYQIGLQYADKSNLSRGQREIYAANTD